MWPVASRAALAPRAALLSGALARCVECSVVLRLAAVVRSVALPLAASKRGASKMAASKRSASKREALTVAASKPMARPAAS